ncbi:MAG: bis(5'-nucleosyl)-tetraphosphatase (symmetrical) YqeK [Oscillospiraceae bacterium]|nr:bis(5'-nucleosyl)-tetraphosphatase (symmetrical) YqeK [Oscillospiraceae bacterium]
MDQQLLNQQFQAYIALLRARLSKKRFAHSVNVAIAAKELAERWHADPDWAYLAGLLHDCCKEIPAEEQAALMRSGSFPVEEIEWLCKPVWHGIAAAAYMQVELGIENHEVLSAARWHTVGHANMTLLEEIVYMADLISADRTYHDVERVRKLAFADLKRAMLVGVQFSVESVLRKGTPLPICTAEAYNYYLTIPTQKSNDKKGT